MVYNDGVLYKCIVSHTSGDTDDEPGTGAVWTTYWEAGGSGFDVDNPGEIGGTTPATSIKSDEIEMTRSANTGDGWQFREGSNNGDNYVLVKATDNLQDTYTATLPSKNGIIGPPEILSPKTTDFNLYDTEYAVVPVGGADTQLNFGPVTDYSAGVFHILSLDAETKLLAPDADDAFYYFNTSVLTDAGDGDKVSFTDDGDLWVFKRSDGEGWDIYSTLTVTDTDGGGVTSWNSGIAGDADCLGYYLFESGALTTNSAGCEGVTCTNTLDITGGSPVVSTGSQWTDFVEGAGSVDYEHDDNDYYGITGTVDNYGIASSNEFSITAWVKLESSETDRGYIMIKAAADKKMLVLGVNGAGKAFFNYDEDDDDTYDGPITHGSTTTDGQWYFVAFTWDGTDSGAYRLHVYGHTEASTIGADLTGTVTLTNLDQDANWIWGGQAGYSVDGLMDEVTVWDRALSTTHIDQIRAGTYGQ